MFGGLAQPPCVADVIADQIPFGVGWQVCPGTKSRRREVAARWLIAAASVADRPGSPGPLLFQQPCFQFDRPGVAERIVHHRVFPLSRQSRSSEQADRFAARPSLSQILPRVTASRRPDPIALDRAVPIDRPDPRVGNGIVPSSPARVDVRPTAACDSKPRPAPARRPVSPA